MKSVQFCTGFRFFKLPIESNSKLEQSNQMEDIHILTHIILTSFIWDLANSVEPDQTPQKRCLIRFFTVYLRNKNLKFETN